ncbi:MAG: hypothetical protein BJ554DRAFT_3750 [Olpidium bornovanus]|uniref:EF-hand domain-containing protein n=1 Tax=Olpidium bornovanus TaxID=278681 RepID=A0A8H7ZN21_9FUNG|nr:MAG: hypothetical protein BJ554DRAFT_3750 [Olpidium bornovanus]
MDISHFEKLMETFQSHTNEDGSTGFDIDKFREVFGSVLGGNLSFDQMTMLFMKIDANSDGTVDWDEFSTFIMMGSMESDENVRRGRNGRKPCLRRKLTCRLPVVSKRKCSTRG